MGLCLSCKYRFVKCEPRNFETEPDGKHVIIVKCGGYEKKSVIVIRRACGQT